MRTDGPETVMTASAADTETRETGETGEGAEGAEGEKGFVLAQAALLIIPLMIFAAFATDIGSWYVEGQKMQRGADAAALAGVVFLPDSAEAERVAREAAERNGYTDATPGDNSDFDTGPLPQIRVTSYGSEGLEVEIKAEATAYLGKFVVDSIEVERYGVAEHIQDVHLGNPSNGLGTGDLDPSILGLPNDGVWLSVNGYCSDHEQGDPFAVGYFDGPNGLRTTCGPAANQIESGVSVNPTFDPDAYIFVVEYQPGSPSLNIEVFEPGTGCSDFNRTADYSTGPLLNFDIYGPSDTVDHQGFLAANSPVATVSHPRDACISNSTNGDGWWSLLNGALTPSANGGFYYIKVSSRYPSSYNAFPSDSFWAENLLNNFSLRAIRSGDTSLCAFSTVDTTCPQVYALDWLPLYRPIPSSEAAFYLAEIGESHAGEQVIVTFFDAAEDINNLQFVDSNDQAMPFEWRYVDQSIGLMTDPAFFETSFVPSTSTCTWQAVGGNPCLDTSNRDDWNDHFVEIKIDIPTTYTCGVDCWWQIRYVTGGSPTDRSGWSIFLQGDPVRLAE